MATTLFNFVKHMAFTRQLIVVLTLMILCRAEIAKQLFLFGDIGGNVTFSCAENTQKEITMMYLQKGDDFVNGFYLKPVPHKPWQNTRLDKKGAAVHMHDLNVSHEGNYTCYVMYNGNDEILHVSISLRLKAPYSKPSISKDCTDGSHSCTVECQSHGGYPNALFKWNILSKSSQVGESENSTTVCSQSTKWCNASITVNCSEGVLRVNCSINGSVSDVLTICTAQDPSNHLVIPLSLFGGLALLVALGWLIYWCREKKRQPKSLAQDKKTQLFNGTEEMVALNTIR